MWTIRIDMKDSEDSWCYPLWQEEMPTNEQVLDLIEINPERISNVYTYKEILLDLNVGKRVCKDSGKPFKSTFLVNTVKAVINHPILGIPAYTFFEDDSYVECRQCSVVK